MVKLITHNFLSSPVRGAKHPYPLQIRADEIEHDSSEYDRDLTLRMIPRIDYGALLLACAAVKHDALPAQPPQDPASDEEFLRALHHALFNVDIVEGVFVCNDSGREFKIEGGIPNMVLDEDEV